MTTAHVILAVVLWLAAWAIWEYERQRTEDEEMKRVLTQVTETRDGFTAWFALASDPAVRERTYRHATREAAERAALLFASEWIVVDELEECEGR